MVFDLVSSAEGVQPRKPRAANDLRRQERGKSRSTKRPRALNGFER